MENIVIGKHTLESLTSGMYSDPYVVFREYIQNAADAIDMAVQQGILSSAEGKISISLSPADHQIIIIDNGIGLSVQNATQTLVSIGNSKKDADISRGFRGIGRLAALGYCTTLIFETSSFSEKEGTRITIDAQLLTQLLMHDNTSDSTVADVLSQICSAQQFPEKESSHYFRVILDGVDDSSGLINFENVKSYIAQNAPVPYDPTSFVWGQEIIRRIKNEGIDIKAYNITVSFGAETVSIYKPYKDAFLVDKSKSIFDRIQDVELIKILQSDETISAIGWVGKTSYLGSIYDKAIKGLRLRKGNILIGDNQTLNTIFKDARFNGWTIGEIFALSPLLIPNARRDNFEKNSAYFFLFEHLTKKALEITKEIRTASLLRNKDLSTALVQVETATTSAESALNHGAKKATKDVVRKGLVDAQELLQQSVCTNEIEDHIREIAFEELDMLIGRISGATSFKAINMLTGLTNAEKRILEKVFHVVIENDPGNANKLIDCILQSFETPKN